MMAGPAEATTSTGRRVLRPSLLIGALFLLLVWPPIFAGAQGTSEAHDHFNYHEPVIRTFADQLPYPDLVHYQSATSPGYHLFMAVISRYVSDRTVVLQLINSLFSLAFVLIVYRAAAAKVDAWSAMLLVLPLFFSPYFLSGAIWLTTDNLGWMFVALALGSCVMHSVTPIRIGAGSASAVAAVAIRQIHVWIAAPLALAAIVHSAFARENNRWNKRSTLPWLVAGAATLAPVALVAAFILLWGGLMPPAYVDLHNQGMNPAMLPMTLSLVALFGVFFLPMIGVAELSKFLRLKTVWIAAAFGILMAIAFPTEFSREEGRWGGAIWQLAKVMPSVADRSVLFVPLATMGCIILAMFWHSATRAGRSRSATLLLFALACWAAAQMMNSQAWQRYSEPIVLLALAWLGALATPASSVDQKAKRSTALMALAACAAIQSVLSMLTVYMPMLGWR